MQFSPLSTHVEHAPSSLAHFLDRALPQSLTTHFLSNNRFFLWVTDQLRVTRFGTRLSQLMLGRNDRCCRAVSRRVTERIRRDALQ